MSIGVTSGVTHTKRRGGATLRVLAVVAAILLIAGITLWVGKCGVPSQRELFHAIRSGDAQKVKSILVARPQLLKEKEPPGGNTPLIEAVKHCNLPIIQIILDHGADVNEPNNVGGTPLTVAAYRGCDTAIPLLVERGALVNAHDALGLTPLHLAGGYPKCVSLLLRLGADPRARAEDGSLPVHFAALAQDPASLRMLLQAGSSPNARDDRGRTVLMHAVMPAVWLPTAKECVKLLLQQGADPTVSDRFGYTVLHHLAAFPRRYLKQEGGEAHINFQQQERWRVELARILIRAGADPAQKDVEGKTAADFARAEGSMELARFLQQASTQRE